MLFASSYKKSKTKARKLKMWKKSELEKFPSCTSIPTNLTTNYNFFIYHVTLTSLYNYNFIIIIIKKPNTSRNNKSKFSFLLFCCWKLSRVVSLMSTHTKSLIVYFSLFFSLSDLIAKYRELGPAFQLIVPL